MPRSAKRRSTSKGSPERPPADSPEESEPQAAPAKKVRRRLSPMARRLIFIAVGAIVLAASVAGFYYTSDAFDERTPVLVAARDIAPGETVYAFDVMAVLALLDPVIPHVAWSPDAPYLFDGMVAARPIPRGSPVLAEMLVPPDTEPVGVQLEVEVPLDTSLAPAGVSDGDRVLLIDPGVEPTETDSGRARSVVRQFDLMNFDGVGMQLFVTPEESAEWQKLLKDVGTTLMVIPVGMTADLDQTAEETAERLNAVWHEQWSTAVEEIELTAASEEPAAGPGELEVIVRLDSSLAPSGVAEGDQVLIVDPGQQPHTDDPGRPRSVLRPMELVNFTEGQMRLFVPPREWVWWRELPQRLGSLPMVLPLAEGTDVEDLISRLDAEWLAAWQNAQLTAVRGG